VLPALAHALGIVERTFGHSAFLHIVLPLILIPIIAIPIHRGLVEESN
jgi:hypothetical protein